jgi:CRISPR system Cascade subunit CasC
LLAKRLIEIDDAYGENPVKTWWMAVDGGSEYLAKLEGQVTFPQMLDEVAESVRGAISEGE